MNKICIFVVALIAATTTSLTLAADKRYPVDHVQKIEITHPSSHTAWENKDFLDCDEVVLTEEDVRFALRHMRRISTKAFVAKDEVQSGCLGGASVFFPNGRTLAISIEPNGRISTLEVNAKLEPVGPHTKNRFYDCKPCATRMDMILQGARNRADERRLKRLEAEGKIPPGEAEVRLKRSRE